ncbi:CoA pyrophosphatase [Sphingomonas morindae]|uniref:CoA pyrophosphatase n=1 Tax=Sphingomonas morindae TaxID=1541170 RepID=A0ABY4X6S3_9SPHN|nr:CoA pyrophosphatase [Sphingomonas morindae]USI72629.1 CoA pyrophosphatase [Sphingomonas morindae]
MRPDPGTIDRRSAVRARFAATAALPPALRADDGVAAHAGATVPAAVLAAIVDRPEPSLLLTRRDANLRRHPGQIAFPGGRADPGDADAIATALREAEEEIGLPPDAVEILGQDHPYSTGSGFTITPVVGIVPPDLPLVPREVEVAEIFEVPLAFLLDPLNRLERAIEWRGAQRRYYEFLYAEYRIWGATAGIIVNLARRLGHG